jgi:hypothetical protein
MANFSSKPAKIDDQITAISERLACLMEQFRSKIAPTLFMRMPYSEHAGGSECMKMLIARWRET